MEREVELERPQMSREGPPVDVVGGGRTRCRPTWDKTPTTVQLNLNISHNNNNTDVPVDFGCESEEGDCEKNLNLNRTFVKRQQHEYEVMMSNANDEDSSYETSNTNDEKGNFSSLTSNEDVVVEIQKRKRERSRTFVWDGSCTTTANANATTVVDLQRLEIAREIQSHKVFADFEINHLKCQIQQLRHTKDKLEKQLRQKCVSEQQAQNEVRRFHLGQAERDQQVLAEARRETIRATREIHRLEASLQQREQELVRLINTNQKLEKEKDTLLGRLVRWKHEKQVETNQIMRDEGQVSRLMKNKKVVSERERSLVRKTTTLSNQINRLERQCKTLQVENDQLRKQMELEKERPRSLREKTKEEKEVKILKKKNAELTVSAKQLQEKLKSLEQETMKKPKVEKAIENLKKDFARQRSKEQSEHSELVQLKEEEIEKLHKRCEELTQKVETISSNIVVENGSVYYDGVELQKILQQASKERLQLEHQLTLISQGLQAEATKFQSLQESNTALRKQVEKLKESCEHGEEQLEEKQARCEGLSRRLSQKSELCADLETQLHRALDRNTELTILNTDLQKQLHELQNVSDECSELRSALGVQESEFNADTSTLHSKVDGLEPVLRQMRETAAKRKELEREHAEAYEQLHQKQNELKKLLPSKDSERKKHQEAIETLQSKLRELDKKCELQNVRHEELILEMAAIKRTQAKAWSAGSPGPINQEVQTSPPSYGNSMSESSTANTTTTTTGCVVSNGMGRSTPNSPAMETILTQSRLGMSGVGVSNSPLAMSCTSLGNAIGTSGFPTSMASTPVSSSFPSSLVSTTYTTTSNFNSTYSSVLGRSSSPLPPLRSSSPLPGYPRSMSPLPPDTSAQIDRIMAKIEQDNKILAELDKTRATIALGNASPSLFGSKMSTTVTTTVTTTTSSSYLSSTPYQSLLSSGSTLPTTTLVSSVSSSLPTVPSIPTITTSLHDGESKPVVGGPAGVTPGVGFTTGSGTTDNSMDYLEIPGKGRVLVYIARYSYDPLQHSPNENPEAELAVNAGDYVYITGGMDEDGFYDGELMTGKRGLVPSNFVQRLTGEDLLEFQQSVLYGIRDDGMGQDINFNTGDDSHLLLEEYRKAIDLSYLDLWDMEDEEDELHHAVGQGTEGPDTFFSVLVPAPLKLTLERQLHKSILISWVAPDAPETNIESYDVYVDGLLKTSVKATERMRALIENVDSAMPHRVSVRSVTHNKRTSRDAACTIVIGRDIPLAPSCVRATNVTATSAIISWLPSNSNYQHSVCVNNVEVRVVKPGVYRHTISGLTPNTTYRVSVRVKNIKVPLVEDKPAKKLEMISSYVDFKTLQVGLPDPPVDIQVEAGPQDGTLLITWLPVTINELGTSNGAPVTGYAVYADGKKVIDIDSPTGDHALLDLTNLQGSLPKAITVRTKSYDSLSPDSMQTKVPPELLKGSRQKSGSAASLSPCTEDSDSEPELVELLTQAANNSHDPLEFTIYGFQKSLVEDLMAESDKSELSDIAEEAEEELSDAISEGKDGGRDHGRDQGRDHGRDHRTSSRGVNGDKMGPRRSEGGRGRDDRGPGRDRDPRSMQQSKPYRDYPPHDPRGGRGPLGREPRGPPRGPHDDKMGPPPHVDIRRRDGSGRMHRRYDLHGQMIIEPEDNLSDKEIYPPTHMTIPSIEITKDSASEGRNSVDNFSDEEYDMRGGPRKHGYHDYGRDKPRPHPADRNQQRGTRGDRDYYDREWGPQQQQPPSQQRGPPRGPPDGYGGGGHYNSEYSARRSRSSHDESQRARLFRALYDYDPRTMSPNPNAADEELAFREGQIIKIYGDMDPDGFYWGEANNKKGYVPGNMVTELPMDQNVESRHSGSNRRSGERWGDIYANMPRKKMVALYDYDPQELSPNVDAEAELSFNTGEVIYVYGDMDEDGFFLGDLNGVRGLVPSNFLTEAPPDYRETPRREALGPHDAPPPAGKYQQRVGSSDRGGVGPSGGRRPNNYGPPPRHGQHPRDRVRRQESYSEPPMHNDDEYGTSPAGGGPPRPGGGGAANRAGPYSNGPEGRTSMMQGNHDPSAMKNTTTTAAATTAPQAPTVTTSSMSRRTDIPMDPKVAAAAPAAQAAAAAAAAEGPPPAPSGPGGLLASVTSFASKISPMSTAAAAWERSDVGGSGGVVPGLNKQSGAAPPGEGEGGGLFQTLLSFAKRAT